MMRAVHPRHRAAAAIFAAGIAVLVPAVIRSPAHAAEFVERLYDPPVGSRWLIESEMRSEETKSDGLKTLESKSRAELTVEEKTADGFRIAYVNRGISLGGTSPSVPLLRLAFKPIENVVIRVATDRSGKPLRVENLEEVRGAMRAMRDNILKPFVGKPKLVEILNQIMSNLLEVDEQTAARNYLDDVPQLATAQSTGMKPGEIRRTTDAVANPLGGGQLKSNVMFHLVSADAATGKVQYVSTRSYDADSMKESLAGITRRMMIAAGENVTSEQVEKMLKEMSLTFDERTVLDVENGVTRKISETTHNVVSARGHTLTKHQTRTVTVMPAP
jgi:hypothetical protein